MLKHRSEKPSSILLASVLQAFVLQACAFGLRVQAARRKGAHRLPTYCIPRGLYGEQLAAAAEPLRDVRVLHVSRGHEIWGNFASTEVPASLPVKCSHRAAIISSGASLQTILQ